MKNSVRDGDKRWRTLVDRVEHRLAVACGQTRRTEARILMAVARDINDCVIYNGWHELRSKYDGQHPLAPYIWNDLGRRKERGEAKSEPPLTAEQAKLATDHRKFLDDILAPWRLEDFEEEAQSGAPPLTAQQAKMVTDHLQLVRKYAGSIARGNQVRFSELESLGLCQLQESARKYDPSRKVKFGAFARHRLRGVMLDHAVLNRNRTLAVGGSNEIDIVSRPKSPRRAVPIPSDDVRFREAKMEIAPADIRENGNTEAVQQYLKSGGAVRHFRKQPAANMADIGKLVLRLNHRQQVVYRGRVLTDPPLSRAELARTLG